MKNIHILPTDKPIQNIYITSDEEIKEGDWYLVIGGIGLEVNTCHKSNGDTPINNWLKKIILTTDPKLIKDGVQAIDDEFLEWFVKNPSCEEIEVDYDLIITQDKPLIQHQGSKPIVVPHRIGYKIIIPKEEPKQIKCYCGHTITCDCSPQEEPKQETHICKWCKAETWQSDDECYAKQETLEEAAENYVRNESDATLKLISKYSFKDGAKWNQERMYSEEDMKQAYLDGCEIKLTNIYHLEKWFEQFKKK